ncbi:hypothetical protein [Streptomyces sp. E-08]
MTTHPTAPGRRAEARFSGRPVRSAARMLFGLCLVPRPVRA